MHLNEALTLLNPTAQAAQDGQGGFGGGFMIILLLMFGVLIFLSMRGSRKAQKKQMETRQSLVPGAEVMTTAGIFGTVVSVNLDDNKVMLELSPGNNVTMHLQAVAQVIDPVVPASEEVAGAERAQGNGFVIKGENLDSDNQATGNPEDPRDEYGNRPDQNGPEDPHGDTK